MPSSAHTGEESPARGRAASEPVPTLLFGCAGPAASSSALCALPELSLAFYGSGSNVVVVDASASPLCVSSIIPTRPSARVAAVAAAASQRVVFVAAALSDGGLAIASHAGRAWQTYRITEATGGGGKHAVPLVSVCALWAEGESAFYIATAAMDNSKGAGICVLWRFEEAGSEAPGAKMDDIETRVPQRVATLSGTPEHFLPECVAATLVGHKVLLALGGTDRVVRLYEREGSLLRSVCAPLSGHRDWVRGISFSKRASGQEDFLLATASTDKTVRVWSFRRQPVVSAPPSEAADASELSAFDLEVEAEKGSRARTEMSICGESWVCTLVALLSEHQAAVLSVTFSEHSDRPALLTASMDGSVGVWRELADTSIDQLQYLMLEGECDMTSSTSWQSIGRFGLLGGTGACALGFSCAAFACRDLRRVVAHTLGGSLHAWQGHSSPSKEVAEGGTSGEDVRFLAESSPSGHVAPVTAIRWEPRGRYFLSCSEDKTSRIYVSFSDGSKPLTRRLIEWARPQVHGHPIRDVCFLTEDGRSFVSAADEKVLRLFDAPKQFRIPLGAASCEASGSCHNEEHAESLTQPTEVMSAAVPELGLSNKPVYESTCATGEQLGMDSLVPEEDEGGPSLPQETEMEVSMVTSFGADRVTNEAPLEVELRRGRLWPERCKLYGHGNDISCVAVDLREGILASASKAQTSQDAYIILWDARSGLEKARVKAHDLTVNELKFSPDGRCLMSVSRDRSFAIFERDPAVKSGQDGTDDGRFAFSLVFRKEEAHARLLHTGCWLCDSQCIATGSRDKYLKLWELESGHPTKNSLWHCNEVLSRKFSSGVSALDSTKISDERKAYLLAIGLDNGSISLARVCPTSHGTADELCFTIVSAVPRSISCCGRVTAVAWRPSGASCDDEHFDDQGVLHLAVASEDHSARVYSVPVGGL